jgi:hypothetical protein
MPGFIKTPADEEKWNAIKHSVAKQRGKSVDNFTDRDWATVNAAWHKSEYEAIKKTIFGLSNSGMAVSEEETKPQMSKGIKMPGAPTLHIPYAMKMPKPKKMAAATDKPSKFFKKEEFSGIKRSSVENLRDFLERHRAKKQS